METDQYQILLVEERDADAQLIEEALLQCSLPCVVTHTRRLSDALAQSQTTVFDVVMMDLFLSDSQGLDTFVAMRSNAPEVPMILLADADGIEMTAEAAKKGAEDLLHKDEISPAILGKTLTHAIERKRHELELQRQKEFYENLLHDANVWVEALDRKGNVILWNRGAERITGYAAGKLLRNRRRWELLYPDPAVREHMLEQFQLLIAEDQNLSDMETEIQTAAGERRIVSWNSNIIRGQKGQTVGCMFVGNDVTERRASEQQISRSEDRFRILADLTSDYVYSSGVNEAGDIITEWVEGAFQQITGFEPEEIIGLPGIWHDLLHPGDRKQMETFLDRLRVGEPVTFEYRIRSKHGRTVWLRDHVSAVWDSGGKIVGMHGAVQDISQQRDAEESLLKEQEKLRGIIENAADGIMLMDENARVIEWSPAMVRITGIPRDEAIGSYYWDIQARLALPEDHAAYDVREQTRQLIEEYLVTEQSNWINKLSDRWILRSDGERRYIEMASFPVRSSQGLLTGSVTRDITEVKLAEMDLAEKNRQLQTLIQAIPDMVYFKDDHLHNIIANEAFASWLGKSIGQVVGKQDSDLLPDELAVSREENDRHVLESGRPRRREEVSRSSKDGGIQYFDTVRVPLKNADGKASGLVGVSRDITERKVAELLLEEQNRELKERNQELDTYTHSVAHDLKNPLSLILGYAEMVQTEGEELDVEEIREYMGNILFNGRKMISIINALLLLASVRKEEIATEFLDMRQIVDDAIRRMQKLANESDVSLILPDTWINAVGFPAWIEEVWVNYIGNAIKHGGKGVTVEIGMEREGSMVRYFVRDNGQGIAEEHFNDLFLPFTRLSQAKTEGHGLGLSIVRRIVEKLGGVVDVSSKLGVGSTFSFTLPGDFPAEQ
ncbi:PAS domain S-box protein [bacterium]|nr:PAS domain S-box protein [bacterium]